MGQIKTFYPEKLVLAILISGPKLKTRLLDILKEHFGELDYLSRELDFTFTRYYDREMGRTIKRLFVSFQPLVSPETFWEIKIKTNRLENNFREEGKRKVNLDPGLLSLSRFILATTKDSSHRIPLNSGIYGEITLLYKRKSFRPLEWTYPDYRDPEYLEILKNIREIYESQLKKLGL